MRFKCEECGHEHAIDTEPDFIRPRNAHAQVYERAKAGEFGRVLQLLTNNPQFSISFKSIPGWYSCGNCKSAISSPSLEAWVITKDAMTLRRSGATTSPNSAPSVDTNTPVQIDMLVPLNGRTTASCPKSSFAVPNAKAR